MRNLYGIIACLYLPGLCVALHAQYTVNVQAETAFAQAEYAALGTRPTPLTVPHLTPAAVVTAMQNPNYFTTGSTPFTVVIAHRGSHTAPGCAENAACAIAAAYEAGADAIELDVKVTADQAPVLGHDVAVARELNNWVNSSGQNVSRGAWGPFSGFPILDYTYLDLTKYPFLNNFTLGPDPNNPTRPTMNLSQIQNGVAVDTYNQATSQTWTNHQLTLYEALYIVSNYYPMAIWLDVKNLTDLQAVAPVITVARQQMGTTGPVGKICLKLGWSTVKAVAGNPGSAPGVNLSNLYYFLVMGTGDLDDMATYNQAPPSNASQATQQAYNAFKATCVPSYGCLGTEISHKYPNAPTQGVYTAIQQNDVSQVAGFHTVPQYSWYWQTVPTQKQQALTYGRTFPRTDGSCCFALTDALNISQYIGPDNQDLRALYSWNETSFSTITTDEPLIVLRDLTNQGKRPVSVAQAIGGTNTSVPSGGSYVGPFKDGLYYIQTSSGTTYNLALNGGSPTLVTPGQPNTQQMWYLSGRPPNVYANLYTITNAATGQSIETVVSGGLGSLATGLADNTTGYLWALNYGYGPGYNITTTTGAYNYALSWSGTSVALYESTAYTWTLIPVTTPSSEQAQQQAGPPGYTYCADGDYSPTQTCSFSGPGSVAYGANGSFRYLQYTTGPVACKLSGFNNIDPAPGVHKACFYAPYDATWSLPSNYTALTTDGGNFVNYTSWEYAYGAKDPNTGAPLYTYTVVPTGTYPCSPATFGYDPAPGIAKTCSYGPSPSSLPAGPAGFSYCGGEGDNCVFSGTGAVAYGADGTYTYKTFTNGMHCGVLSFGLDPDPGVLKSCFYLPATALGTVTGPSLPSSFQLCANAESGTCQSITAGSLVAYGATYNGVPSYVFKTLSGNFSCKLATFGIDPTPGVAKACYWAPQSWANRGPAGFTYCASAESGTCQFNGVAQVAYGADGNFVFKPSVTSTTGIACNLNSFGKDPYPGYYKACFYRLY